MNNIYCFINSGQPEWYTVSALSDEGEFLTNHVSSTVDFAKHDIGITSDWKHDIYKEKYPNGYNLEWVDNPLEHKGVKVAYQKHIDKYSQ